MLGTFAPLGTQHHKLANLSDDEARKLEGQARAHYLRVLTLMSQTGCDIRTALAAVADAEVDNE